MVCGQLDPLSARLFIKNFKKFGPCLSNPSQLYVSLVSSPEIERRNQTLEVRCCRRPLNISCKDHVTNEKVRNRIQNAILGQPPNTSIAMFGIKLT